VLSHALMHFSALSGNWSQIFRRDHALVEPRPCMDRRIFRVFEKSVRFPVTCVTFHMPQTSCSYSEKECDASEKVWEKPQPAPVAPCPASKIHAPVTTSVPRGCQYHATPPATKRVTSVAPSRLIVRQVATSDAGAGRVAASKKK